MTRIDQLKEGVCALYQAQSPDRAEWADWLFENHIFVVAKHAELLAERFHANKDVVVAAAILHDIADVKMSREDERHEVESMAIARSLLIENGFSNEEISVIIDDAIRFHGCRGDNVPRTLEGKVMATADALAHLQTDFYHFALGLLRKTESIDEIRQWALPKIERDYYQKIQFDEIRNEVSADYERAKAIFS